MSVISQNTPLVVLSGGPCAGKTTALTRIIAWCQERGFHPLIVPEVATELSASGFDRVRPDFQEQVLLEIIHKEELRLKVARSGHYQRPVIVCDRGRMDGQAYTNSPETFLKLLQQNGLSYSYARDIYAGVIFLDSAACGAEAFYITDNNNQRTETIVEARSLNERTKAAWHGTPHLCVIPNRPHRSFEDKMWECTQALARILGIPEPIECERKFKILDVDLRSLPADTVTVDIVQTYLVNMRPNVAERVRARGQHNSWLYFHTIKEPRGPGVSIEHDRQISKAEYDDFLVRRKIDAKPISKQRHCFVYEHQYCELDVFVGHCADEVLLEVELHEPGQTVIVPPFLGDYTDVTDDPEYSNYAMAHRA